MSLIDDTNFKPVDFSEILKDITLVKITQRELNALRTYDAEARALKDAIGDTPLDQVLVRGTVLKKLLEQV